MSDKERYAYLWKQTRESMYSGRRLQSKYGATCSEGQEGVYIAGAKSILPGKQTNNEETSVPLNFITS